MAPATDSDRGRWTPEARKKDHVLRACGGKRGPPGVQSGLRVGARSVTASRVLGAREAPGAASAPASPKPEITAASVSVPPLQFQPRGLPWNPQGGRGPAPLCPALRGRSPGRALPGAGGSEEPGPEHGSS